MQAIIQVSDLCRDYKVARRDAGIINFMFSRQYNVVHAVNDIGFSINEGELIGFIGPNGAGKSTTIKMLSGILVPTSGSISVLGNDPYKRRKQNAYHICVVFGQRSQLWWDLPIGDTFQLLKKIYKVEDEPFTRNIALFKEYLDLDSIWSQPVRQLSLGQRMRAEIAAAILHNPKLLFLDEPTIGLDIVAKRQIREFIKKLNALYNTTVILTTHDMKDIEEVCGRIILIDKGVVVVDEAMDELKNRFSNSSVVHVNFNQPAGPFEFIGVNAASSSDGQKWSFEVDKRQMATGRLVFELSRIAEISDIEIKEQAVEDIIHNIYQHGV